VRVPQPARRRARNGDDRVEDQPPAGRREGAITATTRALYLGRTLIVLETELTREDGALVAKTTQTQAYHYARD
jgi:hypothetical protein